MDIFNTFGQKAVYRPAKIFWKLDYAFKAFTEGSQKKMCPFYNEMCMSIKTEACNCICMCIVLVFRICISLNRGLYSDGQESGLSGISLSSQ